jgi:uncharacterized membrane protein
MLTIISPLTQVELRQQHDDIVADYYNDNPSLLGLIELSLAVFFEWQHSEISDWNPPS